MVDPSIVSLRVSRTSHHSKLELSLFTGTHHALHSGMVTLGSLALPSLLALPSVVDSVTWTAGSQEKCKNALHYNYIFLPALLVAPGELQASPMQIPSWSQGGP